MSKENPVATANDALRAHIRALRDYTTAKQSENEAKDAVSEAWAAVNRTRGEFDRALNTLVESESETTEVGL